MVQVGIEPNKAKVKEVKEGTCLELGGAIPALRGFSLCLVGQAGQQIAPTPQS